MLFKPLIRKLLKCGTRITVLIYFFLLDAFGIQK